MLLKLTGTLSTDLIVAEKKLRNYAHSENNQMGFDLGTQIVKEVSQRKLLITLPIGLSGTSPDEHANNICTIAELEPVR